MNWARHERQERADLFAALGILVKPLAADEAATAALIAAPLGL